MKQICQNTKLALIAAVLLPIGIAGCNAQDAGSLSQDVGKIAHDTGTAAGNAQLAARVNSVLIQRKGVDMSGLHIDVKDGVVTVGGHVRDENEKRIVLNTLNDTRGVNKVIDNLRIENQK